MLKMMWCDDYWFGMQFKNLEFHQQIMVKNNNIEHQNNIFMSMISMGTIEAKLKHF